MIIRTSYHIFYQEWDWYLSPNGHTWHALVDVEVTSITFSVAVNYRYSRYKIDMKISIDNRYGFSDIDISSF